MVKYRASLEPWTTAKERQGQVEASIGDLEDRVSRAQIIDPTSLSGDRIVFGATVTLLDDDDKNRPIEGLLALHAHPGPPMKVEFRNIRLKTIVP